MADKNASSGSGSLIGFISGVILFVAGLFFSSFMLIIGIVLIVRNREALVRKTNNPAPLRSAPQKPPAVVGRSPQPYSVKPAQPAPRPPAGVSYQSQASDHYHITNAGLPVERRLEQLEVMKNAGLLDNEEYQQRRQKILRDK